MPGWPHDKRVRVERSFYKFLEYCYINSKDEGPICIGDNLYDGQEKVIKEIFDALENDIHNIYILKSRQLGISTLIRLLTIFLLGVLPGLKGAIVFDTDQNKSESRSELEVMINDLDPKLKFPRIRTNNRTGLTLANDSKVLFMAAGVRKTKSSGVLGRSVGLSIAHCSELCSWDNEEGLEAFQNSLSEVNIDRLYIYESTARGFNTWWTMWKKARADFHHCKCIFLGWYTKPNQRIDKSSPDYKLYGEHPPNEKEMQTIALVKERYGYQISAEQLAWYRRKMDPSAMLSDLDEAGDEDTPLRIQEQPSTEEEAFQQSGAVFFGAKALTELTHKYVAKPKQRFLYWVGQEFFDSRVYKADSPRMTELKVWEEPEKDQIYVLGIDPAYGENENNCRSSIQVLRCFADGIDQVAEYAWPLVTTYQLAWVIASLMGWYGANGSEVRYVLELNGPGTAVFNELRSLKAKIEGRLHYREYQERGLQDIFRNVRTYIWNRPDSMSAGFNYHLKTTTQIKITLLERLRDFVSNGMLRVRSLDLIEEMKTIAREGDKIGAPGTMKDDRVLAMAFAVHCWEEKARRDLIGRKYTREAEQAQKSVSVQDQVALFQKNQLSSFFDRKRVERIGMDRQARYQAWRQSGRRW